MNEVRVSEKDSDQCPFCFREMEPWEGTSEMDKDGKCKIWCYYCHEEYYYMENENLQWGFAEKLCHECDGRMYLDYLPGPDMYQDLCWYCTVCGIEELHSEFLVRTGRKM